MSHVPRERITHQPGVWLGLWITLIFGLLVNPWWVPTGDSEVYLTSARNLLRGDGLTFLGSPLVFVPPGWPAMLAGLIAISPKLIWLKLFQAACMGGFLALSYVTLKRWCEPTRAAVAVGLATICTPLYPLTVWLHSDPIFCLLVAVAWLVALQWSSGRAHGKAGGWAHGKAGGWALAIVVVLTVATILLRWAGMPIAVVTAAACLGLGKGEGSPPMRVRWIAAGLVIAVAGGCFFGLRVWLAASDADPTLASISLASLSEESTVPGLFTREQTHLSPVGELGLRLSNWPIWIGWTFFQPMRILANFGVAGRIVEYAVALLALALMVAAAVRDVRQHRFLLAGALLYTLGLSLVWPTPNNRYLVPVLPILILGVLDGIAIVRGHHFQRSAAALWWSFVVAMVFTNGVIYAMDAWVHRSRSAEKFYARYEAGIHRPLFDIGAFLHDHRGDTVAYSQRYENLSERWNYKHAQRVLAYLGDVKAIAVPRPLTGRGVKKLQQWSRDNEVDWYVHQNPTIPGRFLHLRLTNEQHAAIVGYDPGPPLQQFELFSMQRFPERGPMARWLVESPPPTLGSDQLEELSRSVPWASD